ncbi:hypothetical protein ACO0LO_01870 [Undibacterium sp. TJN25]|uniref:hypothetical protein n=1 Tax=Undibacterium sp. TJN25 TaxID=3413056 RepID=UPI003BF28592
MTRIVIIAFLAWSIVLGASAYAFGAWVEHNSTAAEQVKEVAQDVKATKTKNAKALAAGVHAQQALDATDAFYQHLRSQYETDQQQNPGIGCVLDPVSLQRWNDANAQSDSTAASEPDDDVPDAATTAGGPGRGEESH